MTFCEFAESYGLILDRLIEGRWVRVKTTDKTKKRNGAYKFLGDVGFVQNHATMEQVAVWKDGSRAGFADKVALRAQKAINDAQEAARHAEARTRAQYIFDNCTLGTHPYLAGKGFPDELMPVRGETLVIPMRDFKRYEQLNSLQFITESGEKKFMPGGKAKGSVFCLGPWLPRERWLVEGYCTALSVREALDAMHCRAQVITCFSAGNLAHIGKMLRHSSPRSFVFADNDSSGAGLRAAEETGLPFVMAPEVDKDANDWHRERGVWALVRLIREVKQTASA